MRGIKEKQVRSRQTIDLPHVPWQPLSIPLPSNPLHPSPCTPRLPATFYSSQKSKTSVFANLGKKTRYPRTDGWTNRWMNWRTDRHTLLWRCKDTCDKFGHAAPRHAHHRLFWRVIRVCVHVHACVCVCLSVCLSVCVCHLYSLNGWTDFDETFHKWSDRYLPVTFFAVFEISNLMTSWRPFCIFASVHFRGFYNFEFDDVIAAILHLRVATLSRSKFWSDFLELK